MIYLLSLRQPSAQYHFLGRVALDAATHRSENSRGSRHLDAALVYRPLVLRTGRRHIGSSIQTSYRKFFFSATPSTSCSFKTPFPLPSTTHGCFRNCSFFARAISAPRTISHIVGIAPAPPLVFSSQAQVSRKFFPAPSGPSRPALFSSLSHLQHMLG